MGELVSIILAAGHGTRMKSAVPKVLHRAAGRPLVHYPVAAALAAGSSRIVVVANEQTLAPIRASLEAELPGVPLAFAIQPVPRGTGDAARVGLEAVDLAPSARVLILAGDTPLLVGDDLAPLVGRLDEGDALAFLSFFPSSAKGYGRVLRDETGRVLEIREDRDLRNDAERAVGEVNAGVYASTAGLLRDCLSRLRPENAQGEFYLTDVVAMARSTGPVSTVVADETALLGVNHRGELARAEGILFARNRERYAREGATIVGAPLIDTGVELGIDVTIEDGVRLRGRTKIGAGSFVDVGCVLVDAIVGEKSHIKPYTVVTESEVGSDVHLGPFSHLRPGSRIEDEAHLGNFVETKNTRVRRGAKANHLAYLGDADVGEKSNIGAGTIFCNYDGFGKSKTVIGKGAFIGSDSQLVAPVTIGDGAYVATGTTVTMDVPADALAIGRTRQTNKEGYASVLRQRLRAQAAAKKAK